MWTAIHAQAARTTVVTDRPVVDDTPKHVAGEGALEEILGEGGERIIGERYEMAEQFISGEGGESIAPESGSDKILEESP